MEEEGPPPWRWRARTWQRRRLRHFHREILQRGWNDRIGHGRMPTLREFARGHGLPVQTWIRECERGRPGVTVPGPKRPGRRTCATYDRTWHSRIRAGDVSAHCGETPYRPDREREKGRRPSAASSASPSAGRPRHSTMSNSRRRKDECPRPPSPKPRKESSNENVPWRVGEWQSRCGWPW